MIILNQVFSLVFYFIFAVRIAFIKIRIRIRIQCTALLFFFAINHMLRGPAAKISRLGTKVDLI